MSFNLRKRIVQGIIARSICWVFGSVERNVLVMISHIKSLLWIRGSAVPSRSADCVNPNAPLSLLCRFIAGLFEHLLKRQVAPCAVARKHSFEKNSATVVRRMTCLQ